MNVEEHSDDQIIDNILSGYQRLVTVDRYDIRDAACKFRDIAMDAYRGRDSRAILNFAVFIRAAKQAKLSPQHLAQWLIEQHGGKAAMADALGVELTTMERFHAC